MMTNQQKVAALYVAVYNRSPDLAGLQYWENQLSQGVSYAEMASGFISHPLFQGEYGGLSNQAFVEKIYQNILGRSGDSSGVTYWTKELDGGITKEAFLANFLVGTYAYVGNDYSANRSKDQFVNRMKAALDYTERMGEKSNFDEADYDKLNSIEVLQLPKAAMSAAALVGVDQYDSSLAAAFELNKRMAGELAWTEPHQNTNFGARDLKHTPNDMLGTSSSEWFYATTSGTIQLLKTGDVIDGGQGNDILRATLTDRQWNAATQSVEFSNITAPILRRVEEIRVEASSKGQILDLVNAENVETVQVYGGYGMDVLNTGSAKIVSNNNGHAIGSNFYDISSELLDLQTGNNSKVGLYAASDNGGPKQLSAYIDTSYYSSHKTELYGQLNEVVIAAFRGGKVDVSGLELNKLGSLTLNNLTEFTSSENVTNLSILNINGSIRQAVFDQVETKLSNINLDGNSRYSTYDFEIDLTGSSTSSAITIQMNKLHNLTYTSDAQQAQETFVFTNKSFNSLQVTNFDVKGSVKDKLDVSAFMVTGFNDLRLEASAADSTDLHIYAKNNEFDGRITLKGVLAEGDSANSVLSADNFIFA